MVESEGEHDAGAAMPAPGSAAMHRAIVQSSVNPFVVLDRAGYVVFASDRIETLLGISPAECVGLHFLEMIHPSSHEAALAEYTDFTDRDTVVQPWIGPPMQLELVHRDGSRIACEVAAATGNAHGLDGVIVQIRRWRGTVLLYAAVDTMSAGEPLPRVLTELGAIVEHDMPGSVVFVAAGWDGAGFEVVVPAPDTPTEHLGIVDELTTQPPARWVPTADGSHGLEPLASAHGFTACWSVPITVRGESEPTAVLVLMRTVPGAWTPRSTTVTRVATLISLAIESDSNRRAWHRSSITDHLTGLANRAGLEDWLSARAETEPDRAIAVLFCDVDEFKRVNDERGHAVGDRILQAVANRLRHAVRDEDLVTRWGGDEFVVICTDPTAAEALARRLITNITQPVGIDSSGGGRVAEQVGLSIGIAYGTCSSPLDDLLRESDHALREAKVLGRNRHVIHP